MTEDSPKRIIQSYGLFWKAEDVFWGVQKNSGALWGWGQRNRSKDGIANFRDQIGVYVLYVGFRPIYAGQAGFGDQRQNLLLRLRKHLTDDLANRWDHFSWFGTRWVTKEGKLSTPAGSAHPTADVVLDQLEAILITTLEPESNRQGGKWKGAARYKQRRDPRLGMTEREMLKSLLKYHELPAKQDLEDDWKSLLTDSE